MKFILYIIKIAIFFRTKKEEMHIKYYINNNYTLQILKQNLTTSLSFDGNIDKLMNKTFLFEIDNFNDTISNFSTLENNSFDNSVSIFLLL